MSTRFTKSDEDAVSRQMGYEGRNIPDMELPSNTIEDVDRCVFTLFNSEIPLFYKAKSGQVKVPVIFATGERFAILRRKRPLRDNAGALILPLVSISRTGIQQSVDFGYGAGQTSPLTLKRQLSPDDLTYQTLINRVGFNNMSAPPAGESRTTTNTGNPVGTQGTRRASVGKLSSLLDSGHLLQPDTSRAITEIITLPPVKFFTAEYEITFWCQYTQQMNKFLTILQSAYQDMHQRSFRLETPSGYWFVAYVDESLSPDNNFDDFTDDERLVRYSFNMKVPSYVIPTNIPELGKPLRTFVSSPDIAFETYYQNFDIVSTDRGGLRTSSPDQFILSDLTTGDDIPNAQAVGDASFQATRENSEINSLSISGRQSANVGGAVAGPLGIVKLNPITGKPMRAVIGNRVGKFVLGKGEVVYKDISDGTFNEAVSQPESTTL